MNIAAALVAQLPKSWQPKAKGIVGLVLSAGAATSALVDAPDAVTIVLAVLTAPAVYATPNLGYEEKILGKA